MSAQHHVQDTRHRAMAVGGQAVDREEERVALPVDLLACAIGGLPGLTAAALLGVDLLGPTVPGAVAREARQQARQGACRTLRLCQRALEADARNQGYDWRPWAEAAVEDAVVELDLAAHGAGAGDRCGHEAAPGLRHADALARALGDATRALTYDRMALPESLCVAQRHALMLIVAAEEQAGTPPQP